VTASGFAGHGPSAKTTHVRFRCGWMGKAQRRALQVIPRRMPHHIPSPGASTVKEKGFVGPAQERRACPTISGHRSLRSLVRLSCRRPPKGHGDCSHKALATSPISRYPADAQMTLRVTSGTGGTLCERLNCDKLVDCI